MRGHGVNRAKTVNAERVRPVVVNLAVLETTLESGATVSPKTLVTAGVIAAVRRKAPAVKILGNGEVTKSFTVEDCYVSKTAKTKLEAAGGKVS